ncbi:hypothetical protein ACFLZW_03290 [Chloroflexota bacterium]
MKSRIWLCFLVLMSLSSSCISFDLIPNEQNIKPVEVTVAPKNQLFSHQVLLTLQIPPTQTPIPPTKTTSPTLTFIPTITRKPTWTNTPTNTPIVNDFSVIIQDPDGDKFLISGHEKKERDQDENLGFFYDLGIFHDFTITISHLRNGEEIFVGQFYNPSISHWEEVFHDSTPDSFELVNWDESLGVSGGNIFYPPYLYNHYTNFEQMDLFYNKGHFSDINQNGMLEFTIMWEFVSNRFSVRSLQFYEIRKTDSSEQFSDPITNDDDIGYTVVDLNEYFPGAIVPGAIIFTADPLTFHLIDIPFWAFFEYKGISNFRVYQWDGTAFRDVSTRYSDDYVSYAETYVERLRTLYGNQFVISRGGPMHTADTDLYQILFFYERAGLANEGLTLFLELSDPKHWPGTDTHTLCWLQLARAQASEEYLQRKPFTFFDINYQGFISLVDYFKNHPNLQGLQKYDVSACEELMQE